MEFTIEDFKNLNVGNENLGHYQRDLLDNAMMPPFIFDEKKVQENFELFQKLQENRCQELKQPRTGDIVYLKKDAKRVKDFAVVHPVYDDIDGGMCLDRDIAGFNSWNEQDLVRVGHMDDN